MNIKPDDYQSNRNEERWMVVDKKVNKRNGIYDDDDSNANAATNKSTRGEDLRLLPPQVTNKRKSRDNDENFFVKYPFLLVLVLLIIIAMGLLLYFRIIINLL